MLVSVHLSYVLGALPLAQRFPAAKKLGFAPVEFPFPYSVPAPVYASLLSDHGLEQISIGAPAADYKKRMPAYSLTPELKPEFDNSISMVIDYAKAIGCSRVHVFAGSKAANTSA